MMKKALVFLLLAAFVVPVFADDALTLPAGVMRTRIIPSMTIASQSFDKDGGRVAPAQGTTTLYNLSAALEYGINGWLTAGLQWTPGWTFIGTVADNARVRVTGVNDLFVGAKIQAVGDSGIVPNDVIRFAVTPGVKIPLSQYDASEEVSNVNSGSDFRPARRDRGAWGIGGRLALDYTVNENFFVNLFNQTTFFLPVTQDVSLRFTPALVGVADVEVKYGTEMIFEVDANYTMPVGNGVRLGFGLPVNYTMVGANEIAGTAGDSSWVLSVGPSVSAFFTDWALPMEFELG